MANRVSLQGKWRDIDESLSQNYPPNYSAVVGDLIALREGVLTIVTLKMYDGSVKTFWSKRGCGSVHELEAMREDETTSGTA